MENKLKSKNYNYKKKIIATSLLLLFSYGSMAQQNKKPNILVIWGDDIGWANISAYNQ